MSETRPTALELDSARDTAIEACRASFRIVTDILHFLPADQAEIHDDPLACSIAGVRTRLFEVQDRIRAAMSPAVEDWLLETTAGFGRYWVVAGGQHALAHRAAHAYLCNRLEVVVARYKIPPVSQLVPLAADTRFVSLRDLLRETPSPKLEDGIRWEHALAVQRLTTGSVSKNGIRPDTKTGHRKNLSYPDSQELRDLLRRIKEKDSGTTIISIAREIADGDEDRAQSLARQAREYRRNAPGVLGGQ